MMGALFCRRLTLRLFHAVLFGLALTRTITAVQSQEPLELRILCWNIHHGEGVDGKLNLERIAAVIRSVSPDLVALQEVEVGSKRTGGVDQPAELARMTGLKSVFQKNIDFQGGGYGNAVLSRFPVRSSESLRLPNHNGGEQRGALCVHIELPGRTAPLLLICTHLDHRPNDSERRASADAMEHHIAGLTDTLMLLAGDLNAVPESPVLDMFRQHWTITNSQPLATIPVDLPTRQIDFVLTRPANRWRALKTRVLDEAVASDHRPIFAELEIP